VTRHSPSSESAFLPQSRTPIGMGRGSPPGRVTFCANLVRRPEWARPDHPRDGSHERLRSYLTLGAQCSQLNYIYSFR